MWQRPHQAWCGTAELPVVSLERIPPLSHPIFLSSSTPCLVPSLKSELASELLTTREEGTNTFPKPTLWSNHEDPGEQKLFVCGAAASPVRLNPSGDHKRRHTGWEISCKQWNSYKPHHLRLPPCKLQRCWLKICASHEIWISQKEPRSRLKLAALLL